jgi:antitoxin ParD1/3/4
MTSMTISVPEDLRDFVHRRASETMHSSPAEYVRALIQEDQLRAEQQRLEKLLLDGLDSGNPIAIPDVDDHFAQKKNALPARVKQATRP